MMPVRRLRRSLVSSVAAAVLYCFAAFVLLSLGTGCGTIGLEPEAANAVAGFTLEDLETIQDDERLTNDEKEDLIRDAVNAPDTDSGDRLVAFLLGLNVP